MRQTRYLTLASLKTRYRKTLIGFVWVILNPLILFAVQCLVFSAILRLDVPNYPLFLASGLLPWFFLTQSIEMGTNVFVQSGRVLKSFPVHPMVYLVAQVADNLVSFVAAFSVIVVALLVFAAMPTLPVLLFPLPAAVLFVAVTGMVWCLAIVQVFFRDTRFLAAFGINLGFFLTPIFYPPEFVPAHLRWLVRFNPLNALIRPFRELVSDFQLLRFAEALGYSAAVAALCLGAAALLWKRSRNALYLHL